MIRQLALALAAVTGLGLSSGAPEPVVRVMPLGDSITYGVGSSTGAGYRLPLQQLAAGQSRYRVDFVGSQRAGQMSDPDNEGHSGWMINDIAGQVDGWLSTYRPDVVLLHIGVNDLDRGTDKPHAADRLAALVDRIFADRPDITVVLSGLIPTTQPLQDLIKSYNDSARLLERPGRKLRYVDMPGLTGSDMNDRLHPADPGYAKMAQVFWSALDRAYSDGWVAGRPPADGAPETSSKVRWADFDGDGRADYNVINDNGSVDVYLNRGGDGHGGWSFLGQIATGLTTDRSKVRLADFDGDGKADYILINPNGSVHVYLNKGGDGHGGWIDDGQIATGLTTNADQVRFADIDGDHRADYLLINADGSVHAFLNKGGDGHGGWTDAGRITNGLTTDGTKVRFADVDGDGRADYLAISPDGSVHTANGQIATGLTTNADQVRFADIDGDHRADYVLVNADGSVHVYLNKSNGWVDYGQIATGVVTEDRR